MKRVDVHLGSRSYPVVIGSGFLDQGDSWQPFLDAGQLLVLSNERVAPLYLESVLRALHGVPVHSLVLPDGEASKTLDNWQRVLDELVRLKAGRDSCLITLGGGVIGDLGGFAAASYMRGIDFIQAPTTLLAQVDASVGGKTGVNHPQGKNLIGAFHQPRAVLADIATLDSLPDREYVAGLAEIVKYGLIRDANLFDWLEGNADRVAQRRRDCVEHMVERSVINKAEVVSADEREAGSRALLNFGHSFGHALETLTKYRTFLHGEAVAIGMVVASQLSEMRGTLAAGNKQRLRELLQRLELPVDVPSAIEGRAVLNCLALDKKVLGGSVRLVLLDAIGSASIDSSCEEEEILAAIRACRA